jgi:hypothetical protein
MHIMRRQHVKSLPVHQSQISALQFRFRWAVLVMGSIATGLIPHPNGVRVRLAKNAVSPAPGGRGGNKNMAGDNLMAHNCVSNDTDTILGEGLEAIGSCMCKCKRLASCAEV